MIYLIRHADAGQRTATPEDRMRPLSADGRRQVEALTSWLQPGPHGSVLSSAHVRCVETVEWLTAGDGHEWSGSYCA
jgi:phosphohistidine phosphatase SixA